MTAPWRIWCWKPTKSCKVTPILNTGSRKIGRSGKIGAGTSTKRPTPPSCWRSSVERGFTIWKRCGGRDSPPWAGISIRDMAKNFCGQPQLRTLGGSTELGGRPRFSGWTGIPPAHHAEGNGGGPGGRETEGAVGERQNCRQKAGSHAGGQRYGGHGGPSDHGPCHDGPFEADGRTFPTRTGRKSCG